MCYRVIVPARGPKYILPVTEDNKYGITRTGEKLVRGSRLMGHDQSSPGAYIDKETHVRVTIPQRLPPLVLSRGNRSIPIPSDNHRRDS